MICAPDRPFTGWVCRCHPFQSVFEVRDGSVVNEECFGVVWVKFRNLLEEFDEAIGSMKTYRAFLRF